MKRTCPGTGTPGCLGTFETENLQRKWCSEPCRTRVWRRQGTGAPHGVGLLPTGPDPALSDKQIVLEAEQRGFIIHKIRPPQEMTFSPRIIEGTERIKMAVVSCTHFGSKFQQLTALREFCSYAVDQGIDYFVHGGDVEDGPVRRHRNPQDVFLHTFGAYRDYVAENLPTGAPWLMISGNHDDWWTADGGPDIIEAVAGLRDDITYLGQSHGFLKLGDATVEVLHANDGGAKQPSLKLRNHLESVSPAMKPNLCLLGNYHKFCVASHRNVLGVQLPSFQAQTPWMSSKSYVSEVAGVILEIGTTTKGLAGSAKFELVTTYEPREEDYP